MTLKTTILTTALLALVACGGSDSNRDGGGTTDDPDLCGDPEATAFRLLVWDVEVDERKPDGRAWDLDGSYADVHACIGYDAAGWDFACTDVYEDSTTVDFGGAYSEGIVNGDVLIEIWDNDLSDDDYVGGVIFDLNVLRSYAGCGPDVNTGTAQAGYSSLTFEVEAL